MSTETGMIYIDRSRTETKQHCPREYFWNYQYKNTGIEKAREIPPAFALLTGTWTHNGIEEVLKDIDPKIAAVEASQRYYDEVRPLFSNIEDETVKDRLIADLKEQCDLVTAMVYGWSVYSLPKFKVDYEVVNIEREEAITFTVGDVDITLMTRTDILSKIRGTDRYVLHNLKTAGTADKSWVNQWRYDQQTLTEFIAVEHRLTQEKLREIMAQCGPCNDPQTGHKCALMIKHIEDSKVEVVGTIIEGLVKGKKSEYPEDSGIWRHNNPMVACWMKDSGGSMDFQAKYKWTCDAPHSMARKECPGGQNHTRAGYFKGSVAEKYPGGIIAWIDWLMANEPQTLGGYFISLPPITRSEWEVERWKRQVLAREIEDVKRAKSINDLITIEPDTAGILLDHYFPMSTGHGNCHTWNRPCNYLDVCWGAADVDDISLFKQRVSNHPMEQDREG